MRNLNNILIIDDDEDWRRTLTMDLEEDFKINSASDEDYFEKLDSTTELILLDISMPLKNGTEIFKELISNNCRCKIIVLTCLSKTSKEVLWFIQKEITVLFKTESDYSEQIRNYVNSLHIKELSEISALIIDDEKDQCSSYSMILKETGVTNITEIMSIEEAKVLINSSHFDIYIVDICFLENGILNNRGKDIVDSLMEKKANENGIVIPISTYENVRCVLNHYKNIFGIHPLIQEEEEVDSAIKSLISNGIFWSNNNEV